MGRAIGTRTHGIQDHNLALCQLSYARHPRGTYVPAPVPSIRGLVSDRREACVAKRARFVA